MRISITILILTVFLYSCSNSEKKGTVSDAIPQFKADAFWPKPLPNNWMLGEVSGVAVDANDHIWILHRRILTDREGGAALDTAQSECCRPAPAIIEFDQEGNVVQAWGGPDSVDHWFTSEHGLFIDAESNVWVGGNNVKDDVIIKFSKFGQRLLEIGEWGVSKGSNDTTHLGGPSDIYVDVTAHEVYVSDGYRNRRIIVFDSNTGAYKRHWGGYGEVPDDSPLAKFTMGEAPIRSFRNPHAVTITNDDEVYVADRPNNRIQIFQRDGTFIKESFLADNTLNTGAVWDIAFSPDPEQTFVYVADGMNMKIWILRRAKMEVVGSFGQGGRNAGQFGWIHNLATDSKGNIYTVEVNPGKRVQKFTPIK